MCDDYFVQRAANVNRIISENTNITSSNHQTTTAAHGGGNNNNNVEEKKVNGYYPY